MNKSRNKKKENKKQLSKRIVGHYIAYGHNPDEALRKLVSEVYSRRNGPGHIASYMLSDKSGNYHVAHYNFSRDEPEFVNYGGKFKVYFIMDGKDIYHIATAYEIKGIVKKSTKQWVATANVSRIKVRVEPIVGPIV